MRFHGAMLLALTVIATAACGDDDETANRCPDGVEAGETVRCTCEDGDTGVRRCGSDGRLSACNCSGGAGSGGTGVTGGRGGAGQSGTGGMDPEEDGGMVDEDGGMVDEDGGTPPTGGGQLSVCEGNGECDQGFGCFSDGPGRGFCTATCAEDTDCADIHGAEYTCPGGELCQIACEAANDMTTCPDNMVCLRVGGGGPNQRFGCKYPPAP